MTSLLLIKEQRPDTSTYTQMGVQCFFESEVLNPSSVLLMKFSSFYHLNVTR